MLALVETVVPWLKRDEIDVLGANKIYPAQNVSWAVISAHSCNMTDVISYIRPYSGEVKGVLIHLLLCRKDGYRCRFASAVLSSVCGCSG